MKLAAADAEDLEVISARLQDALGKVKDFAWLPGQHRFAALFNRFRGEDLKSTTGSRVRAGLTFNNVLKVESRNIKLGALESIVCLLAIKFTANAGEDPGGIIELVLAGGGAIRLTVECIDAELSDLTGPWTASGRPSHDEES